MFSQSEPTDTIVWRTNSPNKPRHANAAARHQHTLQLILACSTYSSSTSKSSLSDRDMLEDFGGDGGTEGETRLRRAQLCECSSSLARWRNRLRSSCAFCLHSLGCTSSQPQPTFKFCTTTLRRHRLAVHISKTSFGWMANETARTQQHEGGRGYDN